MSPRAACRLTTLGFSAAFDYVAGKVDGLPGRVVHDTHAGTPRIGQYLRQDVGQKLIHALAGDSPITPTRQLDSADQGTVRRMGFMDKAKEMLGKHDDKVDEGLDKTGEAARSDFGHDEQIDQVVEQGKQRTGTGDTTQAPPSAEGEPPPPQEQP